MVASMYVHIFVFMKKGGCAILPHLFCAESELSQPYNKYACLQVCFTYTL
jgi:hypothetical protein